MTLFERIQKLAKQRDKNLKEISLELGYSKNYLYTLQKQSPKAENLQVIADYFHVSTDYLLGRTDNPNSSSATTSDDLEKMLDNAMSFNGKPLTEKDREAIRAYTEGRLSSK
ncbi:helix-turn-helix domain-containing protein [Enterococcus casseliflavus]|uniref:helix-turn-helix domain-containing protein n=1 Tax=Enterococcus casseliflavus TaxID=37734 RepID=UPI000412EF9E|nr:helix-turn-helix transcriptional regulator [Enterococcus casseliflavus]